MLFLPSLKNRCLKYLKHLFLIASLPKVAQRLKDSGHLVIRFALLDLIIGNGLPLKYRLLHQFNI